MAEHEVTKPNEQVTVVTDDIASTLQVFVGEKCILLIDKIPKSGLKWNLKHLVGGKGGWG